VFYGRKKHIRSLDEKITNFTLLINLFCSPPKGMHINHDDLLLIATGSSSRSEQIMKTLEREIISLKRAVNVGYYQLKV